MTPNYPFLPPNSRETVSVLNQYVSLVMDWMRVNRLKLSPDKTEAFVVIFEADQGIRIQPVLSGIVFPLIMQTHSLSILLDSFLNLDAEGSVVNRNAFAVKADAPVMPVLETSD